MATIPILRPKLPSTERIVPYLRAVEHSRIYSNFGPLVASLEERLATRFGLPVGTVTTVANATFGLTLALTALGAQRGTLCAMPAWTFIASAHAATMAGLIPYFVDVEGDAWSLDPEAIENVITQAPGTVGAVIPVAPFGQPIDVAAWNRFRIRTRLPVVIDAAAGFDAITPGVVPAVVSLHATKVIGVGEGGFVMSTNASIIHEIRVRSNFGFVVTREATVPATNAKLSEYQAAVGLAALDEWAQVRDEWMAVARAYRQALPESNRLRFQRGFGQSWITSTCLLQLDSDAARLGTMLQQAGIETRRWWGDGAHAHAATAAHPRGDLSVTKMLAHSTIALPFFRDLKIGDIQRIAECVVTSAEAIRQD